MFVSNDNSNNQDDKLRLLVFFIGLSLASTDWIREDFWSTLWGVYEMWPNSSTSMRPFDFPEDMSRISWSIHHEIEADLWPPQFVNSIRRIKAVYIHPPFMAFLCVHQARLSMLLLSNHRSLNISILAVDIFFTVFEWNRNFRLVIEL